MVRDCSLLISLFLIWRNKRGGRGQTPSSLFSFHSRSKLIRALEGFQHFMGKKIIIQYYTSFLLILTCQCPSLNKKQAQKFQVKQFFLCMIIFSPVSPSLLPHVPQPN